MDAAKAADASSKRLGDDHTVQPAPKRLKSEHQSEQQPHEEAPQSEQQQPEEKTPSRTRDVSKNKSQKGKDKKKETRDRRRGTRNGEEASVSAERSGAPRLPKRQCALLIGFCGAGYNGMQIQPNAKTIEGVLFDALVRAGAVSQDNADDPVKVNLGRAARTDAGVHAAGNLVSMKLITAIPGVKDIVARINEELPPEIRVWDVIRVQNSFNARASCDSRKYTYFFPSYMVIPPKPGSGLYKTSTPADDAPPLHAFWAAAGAESSVQDDVRRKKDFRMPAEMLELLRETAKKFEGTHNFHNFTVGQDFSDRSNQRFIKKIEINEPNVYGDTEWVSVSIHGQSFMLHQRKMMSALVLTCRTGTPAQVIDEMYGPRVVFVPKMPALGLLLEHPIFESYGRKMEAVNAGLKPGDAEYRPPVDFEAHREKMERFKEEHIYARMRGIEDRDRVFDAWIRSVDKYAGNDLSYLNTKGVIPPAAVIRKGERRENPFRERKKFDATTFPDKKAGEGSFEEDDEVLLEEEEDREEAQLDKKKLADMEG